MEYGCAVWSGGNTTGLKEIQDRFCKTHGTWFDYRTFKSALTFWLWFSFSKFETKNVRSICITGYRLCSRLQRRIISVRTDIHCLLCPSQVHCPVFCRELWYFGMIYPLRFKQPGLLHCSKKLSENIFLFNSLSFVAWEDHNSWLSVFFFISFSSSQFPAISFSSSQISFV